MKEMSKTAPLSPKQLELAQLQREARKNSPVMSLQELRAQTPPRAIPNMTSRAATTAKSRLSAA